jgi:signal transduction histidine kinase
MNANLQESEGVARVLDSQELGPTTCVGALREDRPWAEAVLAGEKRVLELIAGGNALALILDALCRVAEEISRGSLCSILLLDAKGERLWQGAAPSLPKSYSEAFNGREISACWDPCGAAAFHKEQVIARDIRTDPLWERYRDLVLSHGLEACWSTPILSSEGRVLGTFAILYRKPCSPTPKDQKLIERFTHLASIAIERSRGEEALRRSEAYLAEAQRLSHTGSFGWNVSSGELIWSAETFNILGYDRELTPKLELVLQRVHPEDLILVQRMIEAASREATNLDFEHRLLMPNRSVKHLHVIAHAVENTEGEIEFVGAVMDVTERKQAEALVGGQTEALTRTLDALAKESAPDRLVEHVLRTITDQLRAHSSSIWLRNENSGLVSFEFAFEEGRLLTSSDAPLAKISPTLRIEDVWPWPEIFRTGKPSVLEDIREGPSFPWREHVQSLGVVTILIVPMLIAGQVEGVVGIRFTRKRSFRTEEMDLAQALAHQAMLACQLRRLSRQSRQAAVVAERNRMARDIHDTLAQGFTGVIVQLEAVEEAMSQGLVAKAGEYVARAGELARDSLQEARRSVRALRPQTLEEKDICEALQSLIRKMTAGTSVQAEFIVRGPPPELPLEWEENLLRIGQEVLTNVLRHAQAGKFKAELRFDKGEIRLNLRDDGIGFDPSGRHDGFGLQGIRERVEGLGGRLSIESAKGHGTAISIVLPFANISKVIAL